MDKLVIDGDRAYNFKTNFWEIYLKDVNKATVVQNRTHLQVFLFSSAITIN